MAKYMAHWYNEKEVVVDDGPFEASDTNTATEIAYRRRNGKAPDNAPLLWVEEIK